MNPSYQGQTGSVREARKRSNAVQTGFKGPASFDLAWYEMPEVKDWVWADKDVGYHLYNGVFRNGLLKIPEYKPQS